MGFQKVTSKVSEKLRSRGQSLWLDHLSRQSIRNGLLRRAIEEWSVTGVAFSPQAVYQGLSETDVYDSTIARKLSQGLYGEALAYSEIIEDVQYAADLLRPLHSMTNGAEGWVVMPVSPLSTNENRLFVAEYKQMDRLVNRPNTLLCLPVTPDRLSLIEELVCAGVTTIISNVYSDRQYIAAAKAFLAGIKRCLKAGLKPDLSFFVAININRIGSILPQYLDGEQSAEHTIALAQKIYHTMRDLSESKEWQRILRDGVRPPRIVWTSFCGEQSIKIKSCIFDGLIAPDTVLALPHDIIARYNAQLNKKISMSLTGNVSDRYSTHSFHTDLVMAWEVDKLQVEHLDWLSKEWAILLENFARKSAGVSAVRSIDNHLITKA
jgi:transaldolase